MFAINYIFSSCIQKLKILYYSQKYNKLNSDETVTQWFSI